MGNCLDEICFCCFDGYTITKHEVSLSNDKPQQYSSSYYYSYSKPETPKNTKQSAPSTNMQITSSNHFPISIPSTSPLYVAPENLKLVNQTTSEQVRVTDDSVQIMQERKDLYQRTDNNIYISLTHKKESKLSAVSQGNAIAWNAQQGYN